MATYDFAAVTPKMITKVLTHFRENAFATLFSFSDMKNEAKSRGDVLTIPVPVLPEVKQVVAGRANVAASNASNQRFENALVPLDQWWEVELEFTDRQLTEIEDSAVQRQLEGAGIALANHVNTACLRALALGSSNLANEPGTSIPSDPDVGTEVDRILAEHNVPDGVGDRVVAVRPKVYQKLLNHDDLRHLQNSGAPGVLRMAKLPDFADMSWFRSNKLYKHTAGTLTSTTLTSPTSTVLAGVKSFTGANQLVGTGIAGTLLKGDHFRIANLDETFVVTDNAIVTATTVNVSFEPPLPADVPASQAITVILVSGFRNVAWHRDTLVFAPRPMGVGTIRVEGRNVREIIDPVSGIPMRVELTAINKAIQIRFDLLYGVGISRSIGGVVILDTAV